MNDPYFIINEHFLTSDLVFREEAAPHIYGGGNDSQ